MNNPYFDDAQENFDLWTRYKMPFFQDRFNWVVQLNVRNALTARHEGTRFNHANRLRQDPVQAELFGKECILGDDAIRQFFSRIESQ